MRELKATEMVAVSGGLPGPGAPAPFPGPDSPWDPETNPTGHFQENSDGLPPCDTGDMGPCTLPSGNVVIDGAVHGGTTGNVAGDDVDWYGAAVDLAWVVGAAAGPVTSGASLPLLVTATMLGGGPDFPD